MRFSADLDVNYNTNFLVAKGKKEKDFRGISFTLAQKTYLFFSSRFHIFDDLSWNKHYSKLSPCIEGNLRDIKLIFGKNYIEGSQRSHRNSGEIVKDWGIVV